MNLTKKEISDIVFEILELDINPMSRTFCNVVAKSVINAEKIKGEQK